MSDEKPQEFRYVSFFEKMSDGAFRMTRTATIQETKLNETFDALSQSSRDRYRATQLAIDGLGLVKSSAGAVVSGVKYGASCVGAVLPLSSLGLSYGQWAMAGAFASAIGTGAFVGYKFLAHTLVASVAFVAKYVYVPTILFRAIGFGALGPIKGMIAPAAQSHVGNVAALPGGFAFCQQTGMLAGDVLLTAAEVKILIAAGVMVVVAGAAVYAVQNNLHVIAVDKVKSQFKSVRQ